MSERTGRIGLNEAVFREVNERLEDLARTFERGDERLDLVCECGDAGCAERITMSYKEYEDLRSNAERFAVFPGHEMPEAETTVARCDGYDVVEKHAGAPARVARETDPRQ